MIINRYIHTQRNSIVRLDCCLLLLLQLEQSSSLLAPYVVFLTVVLCSDGRGGSGRGTCTCTCETKPVSSPSSSAEESSASSGIIQPVKPVEKFVPQTAALMRTATRPRPSSTEAKTKTTQQSQSHHQPQSHAGGRTGIISVPPMQDYGLDNAYEPSFNEQASAVEPVDESQHEQPEENEEQQEYAAYYTYLYVVVGLPV